MEFSALAFPPFVTECTSVSYQTVSRARVLRSVRAARNRLQNRNRTKRIRRIPLETTRAAELSFSADCDEAGLDKSVPLMTWNRAERGPLRASPPLELSSCGTRNDVAYLQEDIEPENVELNYAVSHTLATSVVSWLLGALSTAGI